QLIGTEVSTISRNLRRESEHVSEEGLVVPTPNVAIWELRLERDIERDVSIESTEKEALVMARRGQGRFRDLVSKLETRCRVTHVEHRDYLRASHCKPWRDCTNEERVDGD